MHCFFSTNRIAVSLLGMLLGVCGAFAAEVTSTPGNLSTLIADPATVTNLTVKGTVNASDLFFIDEQMPALRTLNMADMTIAAYEGDMLHNRRTYPAATIPQLAFAGSKITSVTLPTGAVSLADGAFAGSNITALTLNSNVTLTGHGVFADCAGLASVTLRGATLAEYAFMACPALTTVSLEGTTVLPEGTFQNCTQLTAVNGSANLTAIGAEAFEGCSKLEAIDLGRALTSIGQRAFANSGLKVADLSKCTALTSLPAWAFSGCSVLEEAFMPDAMTAVGRGAFFECSALKSVSFAITAIEPYTFKGASLESSNAVVPAGVRSIGAYALKDATGVTSLTLPEGLEYIGDGAMEGMTSLSEIEGGAMKQVPELGDAVWEGVNQRSVTLRLDPDIATEFSSTPQWMDFKIVANATVLNNIDSSKTLSARFDGPTLLLRSTGEYIGTVSLYNVEGILLACVDLEQNEGRVDTSMFDTNLFIVMVVRPDGSRQVIKLLR